MNKIKMFLIVWVALTLMFGGNYPSLAAAQTASNVGGVVALQFSTDGAAGSIYASVPLLITATNWNQPQLLVGCIIARQSDVPVGNTLEPDPNWYLYSANITTVSTLDLGVQQVYNVCIIP